MNGLWGVCRLINIIEDKGYANVLIATLDTFYKPALTSTVMSKIHQLYGRLTSLLHTGALVGFELYLYMFSLTFFHINTENIFHILRIDDFP